MTSITAATSILNIAAYKFIALDNLHERRVEFRKLCTDLDLRGTIMLSPEGINLFVAGAEVRVRHLLDVLRRMPRLKISKLRRAILTRSHLRGCS